MRLTSALKLAAKHGIVTKLPHNQYKVTVNAKNTVFFSYDYATHSDMLKARVQGNFEGVVLAIIHSWLEGAEIKQMYCKTLAGALRNAKYQIHTFTRGEHSVDIEEAYAGPSIRKRFKVWVNGKEVVSSKSEFDRMVEGAIREQEIFPLLDWLSENKVDENLTLILV